MHFHYIDTLTTMMKKKLIQPPLVAAIALGLGPPCPNDIRCQTTPADSESDADDDVEDKEEDVEEARFTANNSNNNIKTNGASREKPFIILIADTSFHRRDISNERVDSTRFDC